MRFHKRTCNFQVMIEKILNHVDMLCIQIVLNIFNVNNNYSIIYVLKVVKCTYI